MKVYIKYMLGNRCKMVVAQELEKLKLEFTINGLCEVDILSISTLQRNKLKNALSKSGLVLMEDDKKLILIEMIKGIIIDMVYNQKEIKINFSNFLSDKLDLDYTYMANIFSKAQKATPTMTIERYMLFHKVELVKMLIIYGELNLSEISHKLNYSSSSHLSTQFKRVTGVTPSEFKKSNLKSSTISK